MSSIPHGTSATASMASRDLEETDGRGWQLVRLILDFRGYADVRNRDAAIRGGDRKLHEQTGSRPPVGWMVQARCGTASRPRTRAGAKARWTVQRTIFHRLDERS